MHSYLPHKGISSSNLQGFQETRFKFKTYSGRYFKKPELRCGAFFGGVPLEDNISDFKNPNKNPHIIISTPGRLLDLARNKVINFEKVP
jgi:superfamily II DNA/RNA helicase